ncbi:AAA family ATPase [Patescibacteria group bacterium]|nr:AAA family ATPase [Patescibacteria group bacterium]
MYLKSIEIHGFKSFASRTVLDFLAPRPFDGAQGGDIRNSITAVVGPNGSGKSNISDAIRWVMGEQSMKHIRGKKGEDVIFSGSEMKGQMGMASVTLTLDNSDGRAPIDFDELVITRRYYRSGDSEYLINNKSVRLLDLQILLAQAQFGQGSYSVIGQGMIDRLLVQTPIERKDFFDEASGIKEFQIKRHQASLKLHRTKENIDQAELLLNEVSPRLRTLSRQVKKLEKRKDVELQLRESQEKYYLTLFDYNKSQLDAVNIDLQKIEEEYKLVNNKLLSAQEELSSLARESSRGEQFENLQREYQELLRQKNSIERDRAVLQGKLQTEYSKVGKQNIGWLENKIEELKAEQKKADSNLKKTENALDKISLDIINKKQLIEKLTIERTELRGQMSNTEQRITQMRGEQSYLQYSGLKAVQAILEERHRLGNVYGTVAQLGEVDEKYRLALDVASGNHLSSLVVDGDRTAQSCIEYLRQHQLGVATFLPLNKVKGRFTATDINELVDRTGVVGLAINLVKFDDKFANIFSYALGNTLIVENIDVAREIGIGRVRMVTLGGDILETSGSMKGGYRNGERRRTMGFSQGSSPYFIQGNVLDAEEKLDNLREKNDSIEIEYAKLQENFLELQSQAHISASHADSFGTRKQEVDKELATFEQELSLYSMSPKEFSASMKDIANEKDNLDKQILDFENKIKNIQEKMDEFNASEEVKKKRIFALQDVMQEEQSHLNSIVDERNQKRIDVARLETKQEDLSNEVYQELHCSFEYLIECGVAVADVSNLELVQQEIQKLKYQLTLIGGIDEEVVEDYKETKERHDGLVTQLDDLKAAMEDLEEMVIELDSVMKKRRDKAFKQIKKEFSRYFGILFDGGKADLIEVYGEENTEDTEDLEEIPTQGRDRQEVIEGGCGVDIGLDEEDIRPKKKAKKILTGIEVIACPPGKKIKNIQMLSGGERTLTSIALVCAILNINPSPFVVLDEVEAALDEANTLRFNKILSELSLKSQFVLITHNKATMHVADVLYGVTMGADGTSKLVSVELDK